MNKSVTMFIAAIALSACALLVATQSFASIGFSNMSSAGFRIINGGTSTVGGTVSSSSGALGATNMQPFQLNMANSDYTPVFAKAVADLNMAKTFKESLSPIGKSPAETGIGRLLLYPKENYETVSGLLADLSSMESQLESARNVFAYGAYIGYPQATEKLRETIKALASVYFLIGDEFLIDALESRFSDMTIGADNKLDEQICLLGYGTSHPAECTVSGAAQHGAQTYYEKLLDSFVYGFFPSSIGRSVSISDYFDDSVYSLFNLAVERYSMATREKSARVLARQITTDPIDETNAKSTAGTMLKTVATGTYLLSATVAQQQGSRFSTNGGDRLLSALGFLRNQSFTLRDNVNPLGYDNRYIPMQDFSKFNAEALNWKTAARQSQDLLMQSKRDFETSVISFQTALMNLSINPGGYKSQLAALTGVLVGDPDFDTKITQAGADLYGCDIDSAMFSICVSTRTKGVLGVKYSQLREAQIRVDQASVKVQHVQESIEAENRRANETLIIMNKYNASYQNSLKNFLENMKKARKIERTKTKKEGENTESTTITTFSIKDPSLKYEIKKAGELQQALYEQQIATNSLTDGITVMNLINQLAESEIERDLAIQMKNSAVMDFENYMKEKENLLFLYTKAKEQIVYDENTAKEKLPEMRILKTQATLDYSINLNAAVHYTYLAAKALEYKYLKPLNVQMPDGQTLTIADIFKVQTVEDIERILNNLSDFDSCAWGAVSRTPVKISLAYDILGLTNKYLNPTGTLTTAEVTAIRKQKVQEFISGKINTITNALSYEFATSLNDYYISKLNKYNMKIWWGAVSPPCDPVQAGGVAVNLVTSQLSGLIGPYVTLAQSGHSTYYDKNKNLLEYIPVSQYLNMRDIDYDSSVTTSGSFYPSINTPPATGGLWDPSFKGRSVASSNWQMVVEDTGYEPIDWTKLNDIELYIDTIASTYQ